VHKLGRDQLKTTKELLDISTWHASNEEVVMTVFVQGDGKMVPGSRWVAPSKATGKDVKKGAKGCKKGGGGGQCPNGSKLLPAATMTTRK
jgi:hypothetical protein